MIPYRPGAQLWENPMKIATLGIIVQNGKLLLGEKKKGEIGIGKLCGPGGKVEGNETHEECLIRETREELEIELDPTSLRLVVVINFFAAGVLDYCVYVYHAKILSGEIHETADMIPAWYPLDDLPLDHMYESDRHWLPRAIRGDKFRANVLYKDRAEKFVDIQFFPFFSPL